MLMLALDTSGPAVTAALHDGHTVLAERSVADARRHAELLAPTIAAVLDDAGRDRRELTVVVCGVGPGPFTGLRVGVVTARVLGAALGLPVHGVCSLDALAAEACATGVVTAGVVTAGVVTAGVVATGDFVVATDARRREVYWAGYRSGAEGLPVRCEGPYVGRPADLPRGGRLVVGRGSALYPESLGPPGELLDVRAGAVAGVAARALAADDPYGALLAPEPLYLRRPDAVEPGERKRVLQ